jgi:hypothetical protein
VKIAKFGIGLLAAGLFAAPALGGQIEVTPSNMNGWSFLSTDSNGDPAVSAPYTNAVGQMVTGPGTPPLGTGSAELKTGAGGGDGSEQITTDNFDGDSLSSLTALGYSTYDVTNNGDQFPYLKISFTSPEGDDAIFFEPPYQTPSSGNPALPNQGATQMNTWQTWDVLDGGFWDDNGVLSSPGTFEDANDLGVQPLSTFLSAYAGATITGVSLRVGYASPSDNFEGYMDNFTIGVNGATTNYDFDPNPAVVTPLPSAIYGAGALLIGLMGYRLSRNQPKTA